MLLTCPKCGASIPLEDTNVATDLALCRACGNSFAFSQLVESRPLPGADLSAPPSGAWFQELPDGFLVGATTRSYMGLFLVPFTCVWAGGSLGGIYGSQISKGQFDPISSLFGVPFLIGSICLISLCAMNVAGKVELHKIGEALTIFTGIGSLGWSRSYSWDDFQFVQEDTGLNRWNFNRQGSGLALSGQTKITFGSLWSETRRYFVLSVLREQLRRRRPIAPLKPLF